ncbi:hypothetical protein Tco_0943143 [Tanacetum coccineum]
MRNLLFNTLEVLSIEQISKYLKGQPKLGFWYLKDSTFDLVAYTDSDYAGASLDRKSTTGGYQFLGCRLISWQCKKQTVVANSTTEAEYVAVSSCFGQLYLLLLGKAKKSVRLMMGKLFGMELKLILAKTINGEEQLHALVDGKKIIITESFVIRDLQLADEEGVVCLSPKTTARNEFSSSMASAIICLATNQKKPKRKDTQVPQPSDPIESVADEAVHKELDDSLVRAATTASSLEAEQDSGNINKTRSKATPYESSSQGTNSGGGPRCQETMGDTIVQTRFESVSKHSNDSLLARGNTLQSDEDRLKLHELMALCTTLQNKVLDLKQTKTTQHNEIASLKRKVKKLEKKIRSRTHRLKRLYKGEIDAIDADEEITLVNAAGDIVSTSSATTTTTATIKTVDDISLAQALEEMKSKKPKKKGDIIQELGESTTTISSQLSSQQSQDKGKGIMIEPVKPLKKKDQIRLDEETALNLQAEFDEEERLAREKSEKEKEANIALIETWDDIQAKIDADLQLAERMQAQEQEELSIEEKATLFQ